MCYSAQVWADYRLYTREFGAEMSIKEFYDIFWRRDKGTKVVIPRAMESSVSNIESEAGRQIKVLSEGFAVAQRLQIEEELFSQ